VIHRGRHSREDETGASKTSVPSRLATHVTERRVARARVNRTADLTLVGSVSRELDIGAVSLGYERALWRSALAATGLGARGTLNLVPEELRLFYGSRTPVGLMAYVQVRPGTDRRKV